jgi:hypothetical protein
MIERYIGRNYSRPPRRRLPFDNSNPVSCPGLAPVVAQHTAAQDERDERVTARSRRRAWSHGPFAEWRPSGTTHAVIRADVVSIAVPFLADQPFWGALLHRRGLGAAPVRVRRLTADRLVAALATLPGDTRVKQAAQAMRAEDGCASALDLLEHLPPR